MCVDSPEAAGIEKGVALEDGYPIVISGQQSYVQWGPPADEKCFAASNITPLLDLVQRDWTLRKI